MKDDYQEVDVEEEVVKEKVKKGPVAKKEKKNVADLSKNTKRVDR